MESFISFLLSITADLGYFGVFALMVVESSFVPFPSEIVIPPAAYLAARGEMNVYIIVLAGTLGSVVGALVNYYLARHLGRKVVYKLVDLEWAKWFLLDHDKLQKAESYFLKHGKISTFVGRLLPGIRQLISLPAGFVKMPLTPFIFFTALGAGIWVSILAFLGYFYGANQDLLNSYFLEAKWLIVALVAFFLAVFFYFKLKKPSSLNKSEVH